MNLAKYYHWFAKGKFSNAINIFDRFNVNKHALDAFQDVRSRVSLGLSSQNCVFLKCNKNLLIKMND